MIKLFAHIGHFLLSRMLNTADYEVVLRCKTPRAQMLLEHAITREFNELTMNFPSDYPAIRGNAGTCHGIKFEVTT